MNRDVPFRVLFEQAPALFLVFNNDLTIVAVSNAYLEATLTKREEVVGKKLFEVLPNNPNEPAGNSVHNLTASINRVLHNKVADTMALQKYDIRTPSGGFEERY